MTTEDMAEFALDLEERAKRYRAEGHEKYADKLMEASRTILDVVFPDSEAALVATAEKIHAIDAWLHDFNRKLDEGSFDAT